MSKLIKPSGENLIRQPGDEVKDFVRDRMPAPNTIRFHEVFEEYLTRHLQRFVAFEQNVNKESITEIRDFIWHSLRKLFSMSSSNDAVTDRGVDFITNIYMEHLKINNVENIILPLESSKKIANTLTKKELRLYSDIFKNTDIGDICDNILLSQ